MLLLLAFISQMSLAQRETPKLPDMPKPAERKNPIVELPAPPSMEDFCRRSQQYFPRASYQDKCKAAVQGKTYNMTNLRQCLNQELNNADNPGIDDKFPGYLECLKSKDNLVSPSGKPGSTSTR